ncbi:sialoadhesin-like isoform X1 [Pelobates cultripes]|uniref:Sialoadhesin-like isoform X1 n=1 Tax=Pelobates cultripes TaxID=61616 RepID=A0AAD1T8W4_PELCU|nr:sialoadhesin-like isoform X1 [Pelobates cultripes]
MELGCDFWRSNPEPKNYTWYWNDFMLINENKQKLILHTITSALSGNYCCEIHNEVGNSVSEPVPIIVSETDLSAEIFPNTLIFIVAGIIILILFALVGCICWRCGKCQECLGCKRNCRTTSHSPDALYADLQRENISSVYDSLEPKVQNYLQVKETKIDELPEYENV